jgi:two-component system cell cycle response regulator
MNTTTPNLIDEMRDSLKSGVSEVFRTMLTLEAKPVAVLHEWHAPGDPLVAGCVGFTGDANGVVYVHATARFARTLASRMLGLPEAELQGDEMVNDVIGELSNMIVGCAKSRLCDAGAPCVLTIPSIVRDYVVKPFKEEVIVERVGRMIDLKARNEPAARAKRFDDPLRILVVDDQPAIIEQIQASLAGTPWKVSGVGQAGQAVDSCSLTMPDVFLISLALPENSGFMLFQMLRASAHTKAVPILALSVKTATDEQARAKEVGFTGLVTKPVETADLEHKITRALNLDTSHKYFQRRENLVVLTLPANFESAVANDISLHLRPKVCEAVNAGLNRLVMDMSQFKAADVTLIKLGLQVVQLCAELEIRCGMIGSEPVCHECKKYEETKNWQFTGSFEEALAVLNGKPAAMA